MGIILSQERKYNQNYNSMNDNRDYNQNKPQSDKEIVHKLKHIELVLQDRKNDTDNLKEVVEELKTIVQDLDKHMSIQSEKQSHLYYRVEQLQKQLESLETEGKSTDNRQRDLVEKALMALLGGIIAYIFSSPNG